MDKEIYEDRIVILDDHYSKEEFEQLTRLLWKSGLILGLSSSDVDKLHTRFAIVIYGKEPYSWLALEDTEQSSEKSPCSVNGEKRRESEPVFHNNRDVYYKCSFCETKFDEDNEDFDSLQNRHYFCPSCGSKILWSKEYLEKCRERRNNEWSEICGQIW